MASPLRHSSFVGGEVTPSLHSHVDLQAYAAWLKTCRNFIVIPQGGVKSRPGTQLCAETKHSNPVMLVPFAFNSTEAYVLEFGDRYVRFFRDGAPVDVIDSIPLLGSNDPVIFGQRPLADSPSLGLSVAQRFVSSLFGDLAIGSIDLRTILYFTPIGDGSALSVSVYSDNAGVPGSIIVRQQNMVGPQLSELSALTSPQFYRWNFVPDAVVPSAPVIPAGTPLHIVVTGPQILPSFVAIAVTGPTDDFAGGSLRVYDPGTGLWTEQEGYDLVFRINGVNPPGPIEVVTTYTAAEAAEFKGRTAQSADVLFIPHHSHNPAELRRHAETIWELTDMANAPSGAAPTFDAGDIDGDFTGSVFNPIKSWWYVVTAIDAATGMESFGSLPVNVTINISSVNSATLTLPSAVAGASGYNIYRGRNYGVYGYVGTTGTTTYNDDGQAPDYTTTPLQDPAYLQIPDPVTAAPSAPAVGQDFGGSTSGFTGGIFWYKVTAVGSDESFASPATTRSIVDNFPINVNIVTVAGVTTYRVYKSFNGVRFGSVGVTSTSIEAGVRYKFIDNGISPDYSTQPPTKLPAQAPGPPPILFDTDGNRPSVAAFMDQRLILAGTDLKPDTVFGSRVGAYRNFSASSPAGDDDAFEFTLAALTVDRILGLVHARVLMGFTGSSEYAIQGTKNGAIGPSSIDAKAHAHFGSGRLAPLPVGGRVLFAQQEGQAVREFRFDFQLDGYTADDERSVLAKHLLEGHTIIDWAYAKGPDSVIWMVRDDGVLLGMTYLPAHDVIAWHRHDTDGLVESVACIPEGEETGVYISVFRQTDAGYKRFVERFSSRLVTDIREAVFLDCSLTYRSPDFSGRPLIFADNNWSVDTNTVCGIDPSNADYFVAAHLGSQVIFLDSLGNEYRATITTILNSRSVGVRLQRDIPAALQAILISTGTTWTHALTKFSFPHLGVGKTVSALVDGNVVNDLVIDAEGDVTLPIAGSIVTVGLPYTSEIETLDVNVDGRSLQTVKKVVGKVWFEVKTSRGLWVGEPDGRMSEWKQRQVADGAVNMNAPPPMTTVRDSVTISGGWGHNGRVILQQRDPLPVEITSVTPEVTFGG